MDMNFVFTVIKKPDMVADTIDILMKAYAYSFNIILSGETPHRTWDGGPLQGGGVPLAGGIRGSLCQVRGDWEFSLSFSISAVGIARLKCAHFA
jgi:hypothetical protein